MAISKTCRGILSVIGGILIHISYGYFYTIGNMSKYLESYFIYNNDKIFKAGMCIWFTAIALACQGIAMPIGGIFEKRFGCKPTILIASVIHISSIFLSYFTIKAGFIYMILTYGIMMAIGFGFAYSVVLDTATSWFPERKGLIVGMILGGFGFGALIFTPIQTAIINPANIPMNTTTKTFTDRQVISQIPNSFLVLGSVLTCLHIIGNLMIDRYPAYKNVIPSKVPTNNEVSEEKVKMLDPSNNEDIRENIETEFTLGKMVKQVEFYLLWLVLFCNTIPITTINTFYKDFGLSILNDDSFFTKVAMMSSIFNSVGRIIWGLIADKISFKLSMLIMLSLWAMGQFTFPFLAELQDESVIKVLFPINVAVLFFSFCGSFVLTPNATNRLFGKSYFAINYGVIYSAFAIGCITSALVVQNLVSGAANKQFFKLIFWTGSIINLVALFTLIWIFDKSVPKRLRFINFLKCGRCGEKTSRPSYINS